MQTQTRRTTIVIDPKLRNEVKAAAALQGKGLRKFVEEAIREALKKIRKGGDRA